MSAFVVLGSHAIDPAYIEEVIRAEGGGTTLYVRGRELHYDLPYEMVLSACSRAKDYAGSGYLITYTVINAEDGWKVAEDKILKSD